MADTPAIRVTAVDEASKVLGNIQKSLGSFVASVASIGVAMDQVKRALDLGDSLKRMADTTGLAVAKLDELSVIAGLNNASLDDLAKGFKFLGSSMIEAQNSSSQSAKLFGALGVSVKDAQGNMRGVDDVMRDTAKALNSIENETVRAAAGTAIFGKSYQQIAATLRNFEEDQQRANDLLQNFGGVSNTAANLADELGDRLTLLGEGSKRSLLGALVPGMAAVAEAIKQITNSGGQFQSSFGAVLSWLAEKGSITFINLADLVQKVGTSIGAVMAAIATRSMEPLRALDGEIARLEAKRQAQVAAIKTAAQFAGLDDSDQVSRRAGAQDRLNKAQADSAAIAKILAPAQAKVAEAYEGIVRGLELQIAKESEHATRAKVEIEFAEKYGANLTRTQAIMKAYALALADSIDEQNKLAEATKKAVEADKEAFEWMEKLKKEYEASKKAVEDYVAEVEFEARALTMTNREREIAIATRKLEKDGIKLTADELAGYRERLVNAIDTRDALQQQANLWQGIADAAEDAFMHIFEGGKSVFQRLTDTLKNTLLKLLYEMTVKQWIVQIAASVTGNAGILGGATSVAGGAGGIGNLLGMGGNLFGGTSSALSGGLGSLFSTGSLPVAGDAFLPAALGAGGETAGLFAAGSSLGAAIPYVGAALAVGMMLKSYLDKKKGGPMTREYATTADLGAFGDLSSLHKLVGTDAVTSSAYGEIVKAQQASFDKLIAAIGGKSTAAFALYSSQDPKGTAGNALDVRAIVNGQAAYTANLENLPRDSQALADRITLESKRAVFAALKASDLPEELAKLFGAFSAESMDATTIDNVLGMATAWGALADVMNGDPLGDALDALTAAADGAYGEFTRAGEALAKMAAQFDGSAESTTALTTATSAYYAAQVKLLTQLEQVKKNITGEGGSLQGAIRSIRMGGLDQAGKYGFLQAETEGLRGRLATAVDPAAIERLAGQIIANTNEAFGMLSPEQQMAASGEFVNNLTQFGQEVDERIAQAQEKAQDQAAKQITAIRDVMADAFKEFAASSNVNAVAAQMNLEAAQTPITVNVVATASEVNA